MWLGEVSPIDERSGKRIVCPTFELGRCRGQIDGNAVFGLYLRSLGVVDPDALLREVEDLDKTIR